MEASTHHITLQHSPTCNHSTNLRMAAHYIAAQTPIACHHSAGTRHTCTRPILHALLVKPNLRPQPSEVCPPRSSRSHVAHGYCDPANSMHQQCGAQPPANTRTWSVFPSSVSKDSLQADLNQHKEGEKSTFNVSSRFWAVLVYRTLKFLAD